MINNIKPAPSGELRAVSDGTLDFYEVANPDQLAWHDLLETTKFLVYRNRLYAELLGDWNLLYKSGTMDYLGCLLDSVSNRAKVDIDEIKKMPVSDLSLTKMIEISERWNETVDAWNAGVTEPNDLYPNIVSESELLANIDGITNYFQYVLFRGFEDADEMVNFVENDYDGNGRKSVCASVKLHISQTMTMTREAFDGTLTVNNGNESSEMKAFKVELEVRDEEGNLANDLFQINTQSLSGISAVNGTADIAAGSEITAVFRFIPEKGAAPKAPVNYSFGGKIIYVDPSSGDTVTADLSPVTLTVNPSPDLQIDYFMQRNILGDDALTLDRVEPSIPAVLGVRIDNQGYGTAKDVKLETAQPEIVENEKGLLIDFAIIGSSMNGKDMDLGSENIDYGDIEPQSAKTGVWWLTSTLLGHFTKYEASVVHSNSFGNPELSLVKGIAIHELIKNVDAYGVKEDQITDFLVNDYNDENDAPDAIYYSQGGKDTVKIAKSAELDKEKVTASDSMVTLTVTPSNIGWNYIQLDDPADNKYDIVKVVRRADSLEIPLDNVWTTFVTLEDGEEPYYENRLHFLDYMTTLGENDYDIYYLLKKNLLQVDSITGVPTGTDAVETPVDSVYVKFNRKIKEESFDYKDIELYCQAGDDLSDSTITVRKKDDYTYVVNISEKTKETGFYKIEVNVIDVLDEEGYPGELGKGATWSQLIETGGEFTEIENLQSDEKIYVYSIKGDIYVKSESEGEFDIYDITSRLVVKNTQYGKGVTKIATLPMGVYIIKGQKVIVR